LGPLGTFTLRSVFPVFEAGKLLGYLELGQEIDSLIQATRPMFHVEIFMLISKQYLAQGAWEDGMRMLGRPFDWNMLPDAVLVSRSLPKIPIEMLTDVHASTGISIGQNIELHDLIYWAGIIPIEDTGGRPVATLIMLRYMTSLIGQTKLELLYFTGISAFMGLLILILFYFILGRTEEALRVSEERFEKISASAQDAIISMDNDGKVPFWNHAAETILGYSEAEALGKNLHDLIVPHRFHEAHLKAFPVFQKTGQGDAIGKTLELAAMHKDGREIPIEIALSGTLIANKWNAIAVLRDISERKKAQNEIELALNIQRVLDTILNISLPPPLTLKEIMLKSSRCCSLHSGFCLIEQGRYFSGKG
ncbi:MAG: PAS domain S-box protein, partial [Mariprofundaceae bacterium]|nr:PAS domain S-box protein [Mariprofundaceae bacterium]